MSAGIVELDVRDSRLAAAADRFAQLVERGDEPGASFCVLRRGEVLARGYGGGAAADRPWREDTIVQVYSVGKPLVALAALLGVREGFLTLDDPITRWWPEYTDGDSRETTLRMVLSHTSGKPIFPRSAAHLRPTEKDALVQLLAASEPITEPGARLAEHALTYGHLVDGVLAAAGAPNVADRTAQIAAELGAEMWFGVPLREQHRIADLTPLSQDWPTGYLREDLARHSLSSLPALYDPSFLASDEWRGSSFGGIGLITDAHSLGLFYDDLSREEGAIAGLVGPELREAMVTPAASGRDSYLGQDVTWSLGMRIEEREFGMGGLGGSSAWHSQRYDYSMAYVTRGLADHDRLNAVADVVEEALA